MATRPQTIDEFTSLVKELYALDPVKTRFILKYKHTEGAMTLRATNDDLCIVYKTDQASEMRRLEAMQLWLVASMCAVDVESLDVMDEDDLVDASRQPQQPGKRRGKKTKRRP